MLRPLSFWTFFFLGLLPLSSHKRQTFRHIPLEMAGFAMSKGVGVQKAFWAYMFINFSYPGNVMATKAWKTMMANTMGVSEKTFSRYLETLRKMNFIWFKNGRLYFKGLTPANVSVGGQHKTSIPVEREQLENFETFKQYLFTASVSFLTRISAKVQSYGEKEKYLKAHPEEAKQYHLLNKAAKQKFFKGKLVQNKKSAIVPQNNETRSGRLIVENEYGYNGMSLSLIKKHFSRSKQWAFTWKKKCLKADLIKRKAAFRPVCGEMPIIAVQKVYQEKAGRMVHIYIKGEKVVAERMADQLVSSVTLSKRRY